MNEHQLSQRLERVAFHLLRGKSLLDIGSDHAYLPCYAYIKGIVPFAIASEINEGPYRSAKSRVEHAGLSNVISVRKGDGLSVIERGEVEQVTIAGMGGSLITDILADGEAKLSTVERLILQPNVAEEQVRRWLHANKWRLIREDILEEAGKIYEILVAARGADHGLYKHEHDAGFIFGPYLLKERADVFIKKWTLEMKKLNQILARMEKAGPSEETECKRKALQQRLDFIKEAIS